MIISKYSMIAKMAQPYALSGWDFVGTVSGLPGFAVLARNKNTGIYAAICGGVIRSLDQGDVKKQLAGDTDV
jgi:hypothetical protein